jgi:hypothetical protein
MRIPARLQGPRRRRLAVFWSSNSRHRNALFTRWTENGQLMIIRVRQFPSKCRSLPDHAFLPDRRTTSIAGITCPPMNPFTRLHISQPGQLAIINSSKP